MSELKLLPCPFCGGEACMNEHVFTGYSSTFGVVCLDCCAETRQFYDIKEEAISAWNRRAQPENEPITNADRIRSMNDEELADFLFSMHKSIWNAICTELGWSESKVTDKSENGTAFIDWLQPPAETEGTE